MRLVRNAILFLVVFRALALAQSGWLEGTVRDASGSVVPGVLISCIQEETGFRFTVQSSDTGEYRFRAPEGHYQMAARLFGFRTVARVGVTVTAAAVRRIDFELQPGSIRESITVTSTDPASPETGRQEDTVILPDQWKGFPLNSRTVTGLLQFFPGLLPTPANTGEAGQFSSLGARPNTNRFLVDGVSVNNAVAGAGWPSFLPGTRLPTMTALGTTHSLALLDAVEEVRGSAPTSPAEAAPVAGANISIQTRAGTAAFHGSLFYASRPWQLGANDWFANRFNLGRRATGLSDESGSIGGPLWRNHTYFFIAAERLDLRQVYSWTTTTPSLSAREFAPTDVQLLLRAFPLPNGPALNFGFGEWIGHTVRPAALTSTNLRLDQVIQPNIRAFLRFAVTPSWSESGSGFGQTNLAEYENAAAVFGLVREGAWTHDTRLAFSWSRAKSTWVMNQTGAKPAGSFYSEFPSFAADFATVNVGGAGSISTGQDGSSRQDQIQISHAAAHQMGKHQLRLGLDYLTSHPVRSGPASSVTVSFSTPIDQLLGPAAPVWVIASQYRVMSTRFDQLSGFAQDTWTIHPRLSVNFDVRWLSTRAPVASRESSLYAVTQAGDAITYAPLAVGAPFWRNSTAIFDPQVALAWRVFEKHDTVFRASWTTFHDADSAVATDLVNGAPYLAMRTPPGLEIGPSPLIPVQLGYGIASHLRLPVYQRWGASLQHAVSRRDSVTLSYTGMQASRLLRREASENLAPPLGELAFATDAGASNFHGFNALYTRRTATGIQGRVSYSWSHSTDLGSSDSSLFAITRGLNAASDHGDSAFDVRQTLSAALSYTTPARSGKLARLAGPWTFGGFLAARTAFPVDVLVSETLDGLAIGNYRPDLRLHVPLWLDDPSAPGGRRLNHAAFTAPAGVRGTLGRDAVRGFGAWQTDLSMERSLTTGDSLVWRFRIAAFNALNRAQFADPSRFLSNPMFGIPNSPLSLMMGSGSPASGQAPAFLMGGPRSLDVSLRLSF